MFENNVFLENNVFFNENKTILVSDVNERTMKL